MIDKIKEKISIVTLARKFTKLVNSGNGKYKGCCPFHKEKTPSCYFNENDGYFKCFGCGEGGDVIYFFEKIHNVNTKTAIEMLAQEAGIQREFASNTTYDRKKDIQSKLRSLIEQMSNYLDNQPNIKQYLLSKRKLKQSTISFFKIGFLDINHIKINQDNLNQLIEIGFFHGKDYSIFNQRIIVPIFDKSGSPVGFGGRQVVDSKDSAKYINSKESYLFNKSKILFNYNNAIKTRQSTIIVVEGYMDVIKMYDIGFENTVATLGTAFTENHAESLQKTGKIPIFAFDNDDAGNTASIRAVFEMAKLLNETFIPKFVVYNTPHKDLDEIANNSGVEAIKLVISNAVEINEYLMLHLLKKYDLQNPNQKSSLEKEFLSFCEVITNEVLKKNYIRWMKDRIFKESISKNRISPKRKIQSFSIDYAQKLKEYENKVADTLNNYGLTQSILTQSHLFNKNLQQNIQDISEREIIKHDTDEIQELMRKFIFVYNQSKLKDTNLGRYELKNMIDYIKNKNN